MKLVSTKRNKTSLIWVRAPPQMSNRNDALDSRAESATPQRYLPLRRGQNGPHKVVQLLRTSRRVRGHRSGDAVNDVLDHGLVFALGHNANHGLGA